MPKLQCRTEVHAGAIVAPPFIPVPPIASGGTELFVAQLAGGLVDRGHTVIGYANVADRKSATPRDNVIFELGFFMSKLGRHRTWL